MIKIRYDSKWSQVLFDKKLGWDLKYLTRSETTKTEATTTAKDVYKYLIIIDDSSSKDKKTYYSVWSSSNSFSDYDKDWICL